MIDCQRLVQYRDGQLFAAWNRAFSVYAVNAESRRALAEERSKLLALDFWVASDWRSAVTEILANLRACGELTKNLLKLNPATGLPANAIDAAEMSAERVLKALESGQLVTDIATEGYAKTAAKYFLEHLRRVGPPIKVVWDLADTTKDMIERGEERAKLRIAITDSLDSLERALDDYETRMTAQAATMDALNSVKVGIDTFIRQHCVLSGTYRGSCDIADEPAVASLTFVSNGGAYSGSIKAVVDGEEFSLPLQNISLNGSRVSFAFTEPEGDLIACAATVSSDFQRLTAVTVGDLGTCGVLSR